ncbi:MAG: methylenetetrahydrofolate reductase, partial [Proteobacteria bacterium]|nr:methylenetetrahydrofolate reductase [Pseudomonadota bacterium]
VLAEMNTPKGVDISHLVTNARRIKGRVDAVVIPDLDNGVMRMSALAGGVLVQQQGLEFLIHVYCRDRNRMALQADLLFAYSRGIRNVLCLTGDSVVVGDHKEAKGVFDLDSSQLVATVRRLEKGTDLGGNKVSGEFAMCAGAIVTPEADPLAPQQIKFEKKIAAGAEFIQTQAIYDLDNFAEFMKYARGFDVKILAGVILLTSAGMARFMNKNVPGVFVPKDLIDEMAAAPKGQAMQAGIAIAGRMIRRIKDEGLCDGVHIMAIGKEEVVPDILAEANLGV